MKNPVGHPDQRHCPRCADTVATDAAECGFCGQALALRKPWLTRLAEVASLAAVLAVIMLACDMLGRLIQV